MDSEQRLADKIAEVRVDVASMNGKLDVLALQIGTAAGLAQELDRRMTVVETQLGNASAFGKGVRAGWLAASAIGGGGVAVLLQRVVA